MEMEVIGNQGPSVAFGLSLFQDGSQPINEGFAVLVVIENFSAFDSAGNDVMQSAGAVYA